MILVLVFNVKIPKTSKSRLGYAAIHIARSNGALSFFQSCYVVSGCFTIIFVSFPPPHLLALLMILSIFFAILSKSLKFGLKFIHRGALFAVDVCGCNEAKRNLKPSHRP